MGKRAEKNAATTPVVLGWLVKKRYKDASGKEHHKEVSRRFTSLGSADTFRKLMEKCCTHIVGHTEVVFYTTEDNGFDDIQADV